MSDRVAPLIRRVRGVTWGHAHCVFSGGSDTAEGGRGGCLRRGAARKRKRGENPQRTRRLQEFPPREPLLDDIGQVWSEAGVGDVVVAIAVAHVVLEKRVSARQDNTTVRLQTRDDGDGPARCNETVMD